VPFVALAAIVLLGLLAGVALLPLSLVLRYRAGTARRLARRWVATLNAVMLALSIAFFLVAAAITNVWVPDAFVHAIVGLLVGAGLGVIGLLLSRWERTPIALYYTPNRWLVLTITLLVSARLLYGLWRAWHAWSAGPGDQSWLAAAGAAGSLAAGAIVLGYYLVYWTGIRSRVGGVMRPAR
jgi:hypothetical protein